jgi:hypothetical protein
MQTVEQHRLHLLVGQAIEPAGAALRLQADEATL